MPALRCRATAPGALLFAAAHGIAAAASTAGTLQVTASVAPSCAITLGTLDFGSAPQLDQSVPATITVTCPDGLAYRIGADGGLGYAGGTRNLRHAVNGAAAAIPYVLYQALAPQKRYWGNQDLGGVAGGSVPGDSIGLVGTGSPQQVTVWGEVSSTAYVDGQYGDQVTVTVAY